MGGTTLCFQPPFLWPQWSTSLRRLMPAYQGHPPEAGADEPNGRETARSNCHGSKPPNWGWFLRPISGNLGDGSTLLPPQPKLPSQIARFVPKTAVIPGKSFIDGLSALAQKCWIPQARQTAARTRSRKISATITPCGSNFRAVPVDFCLAKRNQSSATYPLVN